MLHGDLSIFRLGVLPGLETESGSYVRILYQR